MDVVELDISSENAPAPQEVFKLQRGEPGTEDSPAQKKDSATSTDGQNQREDTTPEDGPEQD